MEQKEAEDKAGNSQRAEVEQRLDILFREADDDPLLARLRQAVLQYRLENPQ